MLMADAGGSVELRRARSKSPNGREASPIGSEMALLSRFSRDRACVDHCLYGIQKKNTASLSLKSYTNSSIRFNISGPPSILAWSQEYGVLINST